MVVDVVVKSSQQVRARSYLYILTALLKTSFLPMSISRIKDPNIGLCPSKCLMFLKTGLNIFWFLIVCFAIQSNFLWKLALLSYLKLLSQTIVWLDFLYKLSGDQKLIFHSFVLAPQKVFSVENVIKKYRLFHWSSSCRNFCTSY